MGVIKDAVVAPETLVLPEGWKIEPLYSSAGILEKSAFTYSGQTAYYLILSRIRYNADVPEYFNRFEWVQVRKLIVFPNSDGAFYHNIPTYNRGVKMLTEFACVQIAGEAFALEEYQSGRGSDGGVQDEPVDKPPTPAWDPALGFDEDGDSPDWGHA